MVVKASPPLSTIQRICAARGIRQTWIAEKLEVSPSRFNHIEAGRRPAPPGYYERAAEVLGVPVEMLRPQEPEAAAV